MPKTIAFYTLGCKVNFAETSFLANEVMIKDFKRVDFNETADFYVIHSCVLTSAAEKKTRYSISKAHRKNPEAAIIVMGCVSQIHSESISQLAGVSMVLGNDSKFSLPEAIEKIENEKNSFQKDDMHTKPEFHISYSLNDRTRSFLKVQDGCDCYCNYCIVPFARGNSRSATITQVIKAVDEITKVGYKEIVLTGINLGDFGLENNENLTQLLKEISKNEFLKRIRISSLEPHHFNNELINEICSNPKIMPHIHIPIQAGSDSTLKRMGRTYSTSKIQEICKKLTNKLPEICIAADIIAGFPGETDEEFEDSFNFYSQLPLAYMHVFTYSARKGTTAAEMSNQIDSKTKKERTNRLLELSKSKKQIFSSNYKNSKQLILVESDNKKGFMSGFTENYIKALIPFNEELINQIVEVQLLEFNENEDYFKSKLIKS